MTSDFARVKNALPLLDTIISFTGLAMKGPHLDACPFCGGHGCFSVQPDKGTYKCFQCDKGGDVFTFLQEYEGLDVAGSLKRAAELAGVTLTPRPTGEGQGVRASGSESKDLGPSTRDRIFLAAADYYHAHALENGGRTYFIDQRNHSERTLSALRAGFSDGKLREHLSGLGFTEEDTVKSGLVVERKKNGVATLDDFFFKGLAVYPHYVQDKVVHWTCKDPAKKYELQLKKESRDDSWAVYNQDALYRTGELFIVEGENDLQALMDAGVTNVVALCGNPSEKRVKDIISHSGHRHVYLCFDLDTAGDGYVRKFAPKLAAEGAVVRVVCLPEGVKDIDEHLRAFSGDKHREVKRLQEAALDLVAWEILQAAKLPDLETKRKHLDEHGVFKALAALPELDQEVMLEKVVGLGFSVKAAKEGVESKREDDLLSALTSYQIGLPDKVRPDARYMATMIYDWIIKRGKFFRTADHKAYLFYGGTLYEVGNNNKFNAMLDPLTHLAANVAPGKDVWYYLEVFCVSRGDEVQILSWLHTDHEKDIIYISLSNSNSKIIKLAPGKDPEEIPNGTNKDGILLANSNDIKPFRYMPQTDTRESIRALKTLFFDNLTCNEADRYFITCWLISFLFLDLNTIKGIMKFEGDSGSGKSSAADMCFALIYGDGSAGQSSKAGAISVAARNPLLVLDNLESDDLPADFIKMLLMGADGRGRDKRRSGSDTETVKEVMKALILVTAIEPFSGALSELITRTFTIQFKEALQRKGFVKYEVISNILKNRDLILSGLMKIATREILPKLSRRSDWLTVIETSYPKHNKKRANEFLSLLLVILDTLVQPDNIPLYGKTSFVGGQGFDAGHILKDWIVEQDKVASEIGVGSNSIVTILNAMIREHEAIMLEKNVEPTVKTGYAGPVHVYTHHLYLIEMVRTLGEVEEVITGSGEKVRTTVKYIEFEFKTADLFYAMNRFCKENGAKNPYKNAMVLGKRLSNDRETLTKSGFEFIKRGDGVLFNREVGGYPIYRLRKKLVFGL